MPQDSTSQGNSAEAEQACAQTDNTLAASQVGVLQYWPQKHLNRIDHHQHAHCVYSICILLRCSDVRGMPMCNTFETKISAGSRPRSDAGKMMYVVVQI